MLRQIRDELAVARIPEKYSGDPLTAIRYLIRRNETARKYVNERQAKRRLFMQHRCTGKRPTSPSAQRYR